MLAEIYIYLSIYIKPSRTENSVYISLKYLNWSVLCCVNSTRRTSHFPGKPRMFYTDILYSILCIFQYLIIQLNIHLYTLYYVYFSTWLFICITTDKLYIMYISVPDYSVVYTLIYSTLYYVYFSTWLFSFIYTDILYIMYISVPDYSVVYTLIYSILCIFQYRILHYNTITIEYRIFHPQRRAKHYFVQPN